jgi:hypothetical protein
MGQIFLHTLDGYMAPSRFLFSCTQALLWRAMHHLAHCPWGLRLELPNPSTSVNASISSSSLQSPSPSWPTLDRLCLRSYPSLTWINVVFIPFVHPLVILICLRWITHAFISLGPLFQSLLSFLRCPWYITVNLAWPYISFTVTIKASTTNSLHRLHTYTTTRNLYPATSSLVHPKKEQLNHKNSPNLTTAHHTWWQGHISTSSSHYPFNSYAHE